VLSKPEHAALKQFQALAVYDDARLVVSAAAQRAIAKEAYRRGMGARGLRSLLEGLLLSAQYDAPEHPGCEIVLQAAGVCCPLVVCGP
jgi:ATP-dependent Clp protease ATP-binding subunit ClpX